MKEFTQLIVINLEMFICGEIALDALNTLILKSRYLETFF